MNQYYRKSNLKNRLTLVGLLITALFLISIYYRSPDTSILQFTKRGAVNVIAYVRMGASTVLSPVYNGWRYIVEITDARNENMVLKEELSNVKDRLNDLRVIQEENVRLRKLVKAPARKKFKTVLANPLGASSSSWESSIIIDKGLSAGVKNRMPVFNKDGLVGQVVNSAAYASQVQLITDVKSGVAGQIVGRGEKGLIQGTYDNQLEMSLVRKTANVKVGDMVITSGLGGVYPAGLFIGRVKSASSPPQALYMDIVIGSNVEFNDLSEVLVIQSPLPPDISGLE